MLVELHRSPIDGCSSLFLWHHLWLCSNFNIVGSARIGRAPVIANLSGNNSGNNSGDDDYCEWINIHKTNNININVIIPTMSVTLQWYKLTMDKSRFVLNHCHHNSSNYPLTVTFIISSRNFSSLNPNIIIIIIIIIVIIITSIPRLAIIHGKITASASRTSSSKRQATFSTGGSARLRVSPTTGSSNVAAGRAAFFVRIDFIYFSFYSTSLFFVPLHSLSIDVGRWIVETFGCSVGFVFNTVRYLLIRSEDSNVI